MRPDEFLRILAEETGERLWALDLEHLGAAAAAPPAREPAQGVAVIPLQGVLTARAVRFFGMTISPGLEGFRARLGEAVADPHVGAIVLDVHSPGGPIGGVTEAANAVREAAAVKPVVALADTVMASGAYWIAAPATQIFGTASAEVGSIGVMATHVDASAGLEKQGLKVTIVRSKGAPNKNEANPYEALSDDALAYLQSQADEVEAEFIGAIAKGRNIPQDKVRADFGQGRVLRAQAAQRAGMIDKVGSLADAIGSVRTKSGTVRRRFSAAAFI